MIFDQTKAESADKAVLIGAMSAATRGHNNPFEYRLWSVIEKAADQALMTIAAHHEEGDHWDGVIWFDRLSSPNSPSLAYQLVGLLQSSGDQSLHTNVCLVTLNWMATKRIPLK